MLLDTCIVIDVLRVEARVHSVVFTVLPSIAEVAGGYLRHYRATHSVDLADALIAATADHHGLDLATLNVKHFPMFKGLKPAY